MIWFYDWEVFKYDNLVLLINPAKREECIFVNDRKGFLKFYEEHKNDIWVGFNSRSYDSWITKAVIGGFDPYDMNDWIINKDRKGWEFSDLLRNIQLYDYDCFTGYFGLKTLEGFLGDNIKETSVPFDIDRKLTPSELAETIEYCRTDVRQTIKVFLQRKDDFDTQLSLLKTFNLPLKYISKTQTQLAAIILNTKRQNRNDEFNIQYPYTLQLDKYKEVKEWYDNPLNRNYDNSLEIDIAGVPHTFAFGGLHGAKPNYIEEGQFLNVDVASYYPSLMIKYGWGSRNMLDPKKYEEIYHQRLKYKAEKNPLQAPYKLVLNRTYGAMKDKFNNLYDPRQANNVCIGGQLLLLDLIEKLEDYCDIVQSNTDGILVKLRNNRELVENICHEWENRTGMVLEFDEFVKVIQRDVNNYIIVSADGSYKSKGAVVKKLNSLDYDRAIVNEAVVNYFVKGIPVEKTINSCNDLVKFQQIVKVSSKYDHALHGDKRLKDRTLRVFASTDLLDGGVFKVKTGGNPEKFADTSLNCFIINENVNDVEVPKKLDKDYYINLAKKRINQFTGK